jgi:hypothetical protein
MPSSEEELRQVLARCLLEEKIESGEVRILRRMKCPMCAENISAEARKCPHCQSILDPALLPKPGLLGPCLELTWTGLELILYLVCLVIFAGIIAFGLGAVFS